MTTSGIGGQVNRANIQKFVKEEEAKKTSPGSAPKTRNTHEIILDGTKKSNEFFNEYLHPEMTPERLSFDKSKIMKTAENYADNKMRYKHLWRIIYPFAKNPRVVGSYEKHFKDYQGTITSDLELLKANKKISPQFYDLLIDTFPTLEATRDKIAEDQNTSLEKLDKALADLEQQKKLGKISSYKYKREQKSKLAEKRQIYANTYLAKRLILLRLKLMKDLIQNLNLSSSPDNDPKIKAAKKTLKQSFATATRNEQKITEKAFYAQNEKFLAGEKNYKDLNKRDNLRNSSDFDKFCAAFSLENNETISVITPENITAKKTTGQKNLEKLYKKWRVKNFNYLYNKVADDKKLEIAKACLAIEDKVAPFMCVIDPKYSDLQTDQVKSTELLYPGLKDNPVYKNVLQDLPKEKLPEFFSTLATAKKVTTLKTGLCRLEGVREENKPGIKQMVNDEIKKMVQTPTNEDALKIIFSDTTDDKVLTSQCKILVNTTQVNALRIFKAMLTKVELDAIGNIDQFKAAFDLKFPTPGILHKVALQAIFEAADTAEKKATILDLLKSIPEETELLRTQSSGASPTRDNFKKLLRIAVKFKGIDNATITAFIKNGADNDNVTNEHPKNIRLLLNDGQKLETEDDPTFKTRIEGLAGKAKSVEFYNWLTANPQYLEMLLKYQGDHAYTSIFTEIGSADDDAKISRGLDLLIEKENSKETALQSKITKARSIVSYELEFITDSLRINGITLEDIKTLKTLNTLNSKAFWLIEKSDSDAQNMTDFLNSQQEQLKKRLPLYNHYQKIKDDQAYREKDKLEEELQKFVDKRPVEPQTNVDRSRITTGGT